MTLLFCQSEINNRKCINQINTDQTTSKKCLSHTFTMMHKITMIMCNNNTQFSKCMTCFPMTSCLRNLQQRSVNGQDATRKVSQRAEWGSKGDVKVRRYRSRAHTHFSAFSDSTSHIHPLHTPLKCQRALEVSPTHH